MEDASAIPYEYDHFDNDRTIRLLQLYSDRSALHGFNIRLVSVPLDNAPPFAALSYSWKPARFSRPTSSWGDEPDKGEPPELVTIHCNRKRLRIPRNLFDFLQRAHEEGMFMPESRRRSPSPVVINVGEEKPAAAEGFMPGYLWADAHCINQEDVEERSQQVSLMCDIYRQSRWVIVWLGREAPSPGVVNVINVIPRFLRLRDDDISNSEHLRGKDPFEYDGELAAEVGEEAFGQWLEGYPAFFHFLVEKRWFRRGWVIQEVILKCLDNPDDVLLMCGMPSTGDIMTTTWSPISEFMSLVAHSDWIQIATDHLATHALTRDWAESTRELIRRMNAINDMRHKISTIVQERDTGWLDQKFDIATADERFHCGFLTVLKLMRGQSFTDPRDAIYGCLGLADVMAEACGVEHNIKADYSLEYPEVISGALYEVASGLPELDVLNRVEDASERTMVELPSWVPDLAVSPSGTTLQTYRTDYAYQPRFNASQSKSPHGQFCRLPGGGIRLLGARVAIIKEAGPLMNVGKPASTELEWMLQTCVQARDILQQKYGASEAEHADQALCRSMLADSFSNAISSWDDRAVCFRRWWTDTLRQRLEEAENRSEYLRALTSLLDQHAGSAWLPTIVEITEPAQQDATAHSPSSDRMYSLMKRLMYRAWLLRRMFLTEEGGFGLGPQSLRVGDEVFILKGGNTPFVLRRIDESIYEGVTRSGNTLVGETFINGMMNGELAGLVEDRMTDVTIY